VVSALIPGVIESANEASEVNEPMLDVLAEVHSALDDAGIPFALMGGVASSVHGRPRSTRDIDVFVRPDDADPALVALTERGFAPNRIDPKWIFKATKHGVCVDIIFSTGKGIYFDAEMQEKSVAGSFRGVEVRVIAPEDLVVIKAVVHDEASPRHWYDALGILGSRELDWDYLLHRAKKAQRRVLSLLLYAQSLDYAIPEEVIRRLLDRIQDRRHGS
jgi:predicted nucleotidyltransferase